MTIAELQKGNKKGLCALDPDLPLLAAEAAVDIDNLLKKNKKDLKAIRNLAERLKNSIEIIPVDNSLHALMDPATITVLGEAVEQITRGTSALLIQDLLTVTNRIAENLSDQDLPEKRDQLEETRDFCVALSNAALAYNKSIRDLHPSHPNRR